MADSFYDLSNHFCCVSPVKAAGSSTLFSIASAFTVYTKSMEGQRLTSLQSCWLLGGYLLMLTGNSED